MNSKQIILQMKYARIIDGIANALKITRKEAMRQFYHSLTFQMIQEGIADLHCRSDQYLVDEFLLEKKENGHEQ